MLKRQLYRIARMATICVSMVEAMLLSFFVRNKYKQIVICGIPRSGTSLTFNLIAKLVIGMAPKFPPGKKVIGAKGAVGYSKEISGLNLLYKPGNFITKLPDDIFQVKKFYERNILHKEILFIIVTRDLRDVLVSKHQWNDDVYYLGFNHKNTVTGKLLLNRGLKAYLSALENVQQLSSRLNEKSKIQIEFVDYEELSNRPDIFVELLSKHRFSNRGEGYWRDVNPTSVNSVYEKNEAAASVVCRVSSKWKKVENRARIIEQFSSNPCLLESLVQLGYEKDYSWFENFKKEHSQN